MCNHIFFIITSDWLRIELCNCDYTSNVVVLCLPCCATSSTNNYIRMAFVRHVSCLTVKRKQNVVYWFDINCDSCTIRLSSMHKHRRCCCADGIQMSSSEWMDSRYAREATRTDGTRTVTALSSTWSFVVKVKCGQQTARLVCVCVCTVYVCSLPLCILIFWFVVRIMFDDHMRGSCVWTY